MLDNENRQKLLALGNEHVMRKVEEAIQLCNPAKVTVLTDSPDDVKYIRNLSIEMGEERKLATEGHTVHFDGYYDQARDKANTKYLLPAGVFISKYINSTDRDTGLKEVLGFMKGAMQGKEMFIRFFSLGPLASQFSILALQITDSTYVAHSEDMLYRPGYEQFKKLNGSDDFFFFLHSAGRLENGNSADIDKRRIYIDLETDSVDGVLCRWAYMLTTDPDAAFSETRRVLRTGGRLAFSVWAAPERNPVLSLVGRVLESQGYIERPEPGAPSAFAMAWNP